MPTADTAPVRSLRERLMSLRAAAMLFRNTVVSCSVFALGLGLLWLMVQKLGMNVYLATAISFIVANSLHYLLGRLWIFPDSDRSLHSGYFYFFVNSGIGLASTMALFALFTEMVDLDYITARIVASVFAGLAIFASNAVLNFKVL